ncbi:MAG: response regulator [Chloroflexota bacterium]|nr:response regulator [Chloroflexota bacterium]
MARVLFIDDDFFTLETYEKILSLYGHEALLSDSGREALKLARENSPDLIILDRQMPDTDGFTLLKKLRLDVATATTPIIMLTASHDTFSERAKAEGAQDFFSKPIRAKELIAIIEKYTSD